MTTRSSEAVLEGVTHGVTSSCINPAHVRTALVERQIAEQAGSSLSMDGGWTAR